MQPKVSIITVNYNQAGLTAQLLESLGHCGYGNLEIFVVDNGSVEDSSFLAIDFPAIKYIKSDDNLGFAGGNNLAISVCTGDFVLLINNDTTVTKGFLQPLVEACSPSYVAVASPLIIFDEAPNLIQYAGTPRINKITGRGHTRGYKTENKGQYSLTQETDLCHGACMMIKKAVIDELGMLDPTYFLFYEEYDYCERIHAHGYKILYVGASSIYHKQSMSVGKISALKAYYMARNRVYFIRKNFDLGYKIMALLFYFLLALPKNMLLYMFKYQKANALSTLKGAFNGAFLPFNR